MDKSIKRKWKPQDAQSKAPAGFCRRCLREIYEAKPGPLCPDCRRLRREESP